MNYDKFQIIISFTIYFIVSFIFSTNLSSEIKLNEPALIYKVRGDHYRRIGLFSEALNEYDKALTIKKDFPECYYWSAIIYKKKGLYSQAMYEIKSTLKYLKKLWLNDPALKRKQLYYDTLFLEVEVLLLNKDSHETNWTGIIIEKIDKMIAELKDVRNKLGGEFKFYLKYRLGRAYFYRGILEIIKELGESYKGEINISNLWKLTTNQINKIVGHFKKSATFQYKSDVSYYYQYLLYKVNQNKKNAKHSFEKALELNPNIENDYQKHVYEE